MVVPTVASGIEQFHHFTRDRVAPFDSRILSVVASHPRPGEVVFFIGPTRERGTICSTEKDEVEQSDGLRQYSQRNSARSSTRLRTGCGSRGLGIGLPVYETRFGNTQLRPYGSQIDTAELGKFDNVFQTPNIGGLDGFRQAN